MKKIFVFLLTLIMVTCLFACGKSSKDTEDKTTKNETTNKTIKEKSSTTKDDSKTEHKVLVVYFSATHTTQGVAKKIADVLNADLYEIKPQDPYTDEDLDYNNDKSRSTVEMNDPDARPAIAGSVKNMEQYKTVFLGYPIWWGEAPRILSTFVESYDFSEKTMIPFCTSGGSGIGNSANKLKELTNGAKWLDGKRFEGNDSKKTIEKWTNSLKKNLDV